MSMTRSAVLTASQCATYDEVKRLVRRWTGLSDGVGTHFLASMLAGLVTTTATNPVDMIKTQLYMDAGGGKGGRRHRAAETVRLSKEARGGVRVRVFGRGWRERGMRSRRFCGGTDRAG